MRNFHHLFAFFITLPSLLIAHSVEPRLLLDARPQPINSLSLNMKMIGLAGFDNLGFINLGFVIAAIDVFLTNVIHFFTLWAQMEYLTHED